MSSPPKPVGRPDPEAVEAVPEQPEAGVATAPARARRPGTWRSLVVSMALVFVVVAAWLVLVPRPAQIERPALDAAAKAREINSQVGWPVSVLPATGGWRATSLSWTRSPEGLPSWQVGFHRRPDDQAYVSIGQTRLEGDDKANAAWLARQVRDGNAVGDQQVGSVRWTRFVSSGEPARRSLVARAAAGDPRVLTTVLTGNVSFEELGSLAAALQTLPARRPASGPSSGGPGVPSTG